ncbi:MAG: cytochrome c3 family protein [Coriobacteriia bacterium]
MKQKRSRLAAPEVLALIGAAVAIVGCLMLGGCADSKASPAASGKGSEAASTATTGTAGAMTMNKHTEFGVQCSSCHKETDQSAYSAPNQEACLSCHGGSYDKLAALTADAAGSSTYAVNPHASHIGDADCALCHKNHQDSVLYCNDCHTPKFEYAIP